MTTGNKITSLTRVVEFENSFSLKEFMEPPFIFPDDVVKKYVNGHEFMIYKKTVKQSGLPEDHLERITKIPIDSHFYGHGKHDLRVSKFVFGTRQPSQNGLFELKCVRTVFDSKNKLIDFRKNYRKQLGVFQMPFEDSSKGGVPVEKKDFLSFLDVEEISGDDGMGREIRICMNSLDAEHDRYTYGAQCPTTHMTSEIVFYIDTEKKTSEYKMRHSDVDVLRHQRLPEDHFTTERYKKATDEMARNLKIYGDFFPNRFQDLTEQFENRHKELLKKGW